MYDEVFSTDIMKGGKSALKFFEKNINARNYIHNLIEPVCHTTSHKLEKSIFQQDILLLRLHPSVIKKLPRLKPEIQINSSRRH